MFARTRFTNASICIFGMVLSFATGCSTASSLGLPFSSGPHRLTAVTNQLRQTADRPAPLPRELAKHVVAEYRVEQGDVLIVEPDNFASTIRLPSDQPVQLDGTIELGRFGRLRVVGKTVPEIELEVREIIERQLQSETEAEADDPADSEPSNGGSVSVRLVSRESKVFYIVGEVNAPGAYPLAGRETILDAIMTAGGLTDRANEHKMIFARPTTPESCRLVLPVCYRQIVQLGDTSTNYQVMPGDRIFVPSMTFHDDLKQSLTFGRKESCPRCAGAQRPCVAGSVCGAGPGSACTCGPGAL